MKMSNVFLGLIAFLGAGLFLTYAMISDFKFEVDTSEEYGEETVEEESTPNYKHIYAKELDVLESTISSKAKQHKINGSVLVAYKDQVLYRQDFGYKNPIKKVPLTPGLSYQLASVSKQYTAAAILKLHEDGLINIDEPVASYLPSFKFENVSIKDLLKHRSGLWNYMYLTEQYWKDDIAPNNIEVVNLLNLHAPRLNFQPGKHFSYSNTGYVVLGAIVEHVSQQPFGEFLKKEFFLPLCLDETYVEKTPKNASNILNGYQAYKRSFIQLPAGFHNNALGDKGIYATPEDLLAWFTHLKNGEILGSESLDLMFGKGTNEHNERYGMGFRLDKKGTHPVIYHNGLWDGFRNGLEFHPDQDLVVIVMTHTQNKQKQYFQKHLVKTAKDLIQSAESRVQREANDSELVL